MRDAADYIVPGLEEHPEAHVAALRFWTAPVPFDPNAKTAGEPVHVFANEGRWIAQCPDCLGAQLASETDPRFMCTCCGNVNNARQFRPLAWPRNRAALEDALHERPMVNQNWLPGETAAAVRAETKRRVALEQRRAAGVVGTGWFTEPKPKRPTAATKKRKAARP